MLRELLKALTLAARSRSIQHLGGAEYGILADEVGAPLDPFTAYNIHLAADYGRQFFLHIDKFKKAYMGVRQKCHKHINIAFGAEIVSEYGAKQGQLSYFPLATELPEWQLYQD